MTTNTVSTKRSLGRTGLQVSPLGLGVMEFSRGGGLAYNMFPAIAQEEKNAIVKTALDGGISFFDTAEVYGGGVSERSLATALRAAGKSDGEVIVATKWLPLFRTAGNIARSIHDRLRFLDGYSIGLYMVHVPISFSSPEAEMDAMADLVAAGKIRSVGVSNFDARRMRRAHKELQRRGLPLAANQVAYSLLQRGIETNGVLETAQELGVTIIAHTPLAQGMLTGRYHEDPTLLKRQSILRRWALRSKFESSCPVIAAVEEIAVRRQASPAQVALSWLINFSGETVVAIPGATKAHQVQDSAGAMALNLSKDELTCLDKVSRSFR